jgi:hypothetical protein
MGSVVQNANRLIANASSASFWQMVFLVSFMLVFGPAYLHSQCPDNGQTKVGVVYGDGKSATRYYLVIAGEPGRGQRGGDHLATVVHRANCPACRCKLNRSSLRGTRN